MEDYHWHSVGCLKWSQYFDDPEPPAFWVASTLASITGTDVFDTKYGTSECWARLDDYYRKQLGYFLGYRNCYYVLQ